MKNILLSAVALFLMLGFTAPAGYDIGDEGADFRLKNVDGEFVSMNSLGDIKGVIVTFTCNSCPYAKLYEQRIIDLDNTFRPQGFPVVAINPNDPQRKPEDSFENMAARSEKMDYPFPYVFDETQEVARAFGATNTPHNYLLEKNEEGKFVVRYIGAIDDNPQDASAVTKRYVEDAIEALRKGEEPAVTSTKAIGCSIKTKPGFKAD